jgi:hypothetical protein
MSGGGGVAGYFDDLGRLVSEEWGRRGRRAGTLSEAATAALGTLPPGPEVGALAVLEHAARREDLPASQSALADVFGQPPLVLFAADDFYIQALNWIDGTTDVHQHGFDGAFAVAEGLSLHVPYRFAPTGRLADGHLVVGDLSMGEPELLRPGAVRPIISGFGFVHALFHLERPTLTVVVRNVSSELDYPQYSYLRPGLGYDKLWTDKRTGKRLQAIGAMHRLDPASARRAVAEIVSEAPVWLAFLAAHDALYRSGWTDDVAELCGTLGRRVPALAGVLEPAFEIETQLGNVLSRRALLTERHHRTFLALLANLPDRAAVRSVVGALYPGSEPERRILEWVSELSSPRYRSVSGLRLTDDQRATIRARLEQETSVHDVLGSLATGIDAPPLLRELLTV